MDTLAPTTQAPAAIPLDLARRLADPAQPAVAGDRPSRAEALPALRETLIALVGEEGPDLSLRQLTTLLILATEPGPHSVRHLAARMLVSKPAITRAMDRLAHLDLARRRPDPTDGRSPLLEATTAGRAYARTIGAALAARLAGG